MFWWTITEPSLRTAPIFTKFDPSPVWFTFATPAQPKARVQYILLEHYRGDQHHCQGRLRAEGGAPTLWVDFLMEGASVITKAPNFYTKRWPNNSTS